MPTTPTYSPGDVVVVVDERDLNWQGEGVVCPPPHGYITDNGQVFVSIDGDRIWYNEFQLRKGRLGDGVRSIYLSVGELLALVKHDPEVRGLLSPELQAALEARPEAYYAEAVASARARIAAAFSLMMDKW